MNKLTIIIIIIGIVVNNAGTYILYKINLSYFNKFVSLIPHELEDYQESGELVTEKVEKEFVTALNYYNKYFRKGTTDTSRNGTYKQLWSEYFNIYLRHEASYGKGLNDGIKFSLYLTNIILCVLLIINIFVIRKKNVV